MALGLRDSTAALIQQAGFGADEPLVVGVRQRGEPPVFLTRGLSADTVLYTASLSKQVTAACAALLVQRARLDTSSTLAQWMPELPAWAHGITVRHLIHHTSGLPEGVDFDDLDRAGLDRTTAGVIEALTRHDRLDGTPGTAFRYCNAGYVCLAVVVERAAGRPLPAFADDNVFRPLGMSATRYWAGPAPHPPGAAPTPAQCPAALSLGDGGMWSTAPDLIRWNDALERDELGVSELLQTPGRLDDGTPLDYAWGLGVREHAGRRIHRHGGRWAGVCTQLVRVAGEGSSFVVIALDDDEDRTERLATSLLTAGE
ncbi:serine hydrolase domain-containing protein [Actinoplanes sp. NPDC049316]|uniref:serine hydrolase domain-containing protein n=1 Tax=Actinoplanes sp. NPDC049316 TaxID=3154727 RepID=UPI003441FB8C